MHEFVRILRKILRRYDYDVRRSKAYNILPLSNAEPYPSLKRLENSLGNEVKISSPINGTLKIIIRTCLREERALHKTQRISKADLLQTIKRSVKSLVKSVNYALEQKSIPKIELLVLDDHSEAHYLKEIENIISALQCFWNIENTHERGQGESLYQQFKIAKADDALYYFCEDDYLHEKSAIHEMWLFYLHLYQMTGQHLLLHPQESESLYSNLYPSYVLLSPYRHWRSMSHATHALFTHSSVVKQYWQHFENTRYVGDPKNRHLGSESKTTNLIFEHLPGFCPLPPLAVHLQNENTLPPLFDWKRLWEENECV